MTDKYFCLSPEIIIHKNINPKMLTLITLKGHKHDQVFFSGYVFVFLPFL